MSANEKYVTAGLAALGMICFTTLIALGKMTPRDAAEIVKALVIPIGGLL